MAQETGRVVLFPPLPPRPEAPRCPPDERQERFQRIVGKLDEQLGNEVVLRTANTVRGFPASAVNLGRLKDALESAIAGFDMPLVRERWEGDIHAWMAATVMDCGASTRT